MREEDTLPEPVAWEVRSIDQGTWVVMGSSTAAGAGASSRNGWFEVLLRDLQPLFAGGVNLAKGGTVTYHGLNLSSPAMPGRPTPLAEHNIDRALRDDPVLLLISYPSNDTGVGYTLAETVGNLLNIREQALSQSVPVIVLSSQPRNDFPAERLAKLRRIDEHLAAWVGPCFVQIHALLADEQGMLSVAYSYDGVHPNDLGHRLIAEQVRQVLLGGECVTLPAEQ